MTLMRTVALIDKIFDHFPLFDKFVRHIELNNSVIYVQRNPPKPFLQFTYNV